VLSYSIYVYSGPIGSLSLAEVISKENFYEHVAKKRNSGGFLEAVSPRLQSIVGYLSVRLKQRYHLLHDL